MTDNNNIETIINTFGQFESKYPSVEYSFNKFKYNLKRTNLQIKELILTPVSDEETFSIKVVQDGEGDLKVNTNS